MSKLPLIATGAAVSALAVGVVAIVTMKSGSEPAPAEVKPAAKTAKAEQAERDDPTYEAKRVEAKDLVPFTKLGQALKLGDDDKLVAINGRTITGNGGLDTVDVVMRGLAIYDTSSLFVDVERKGIRSLVRIDIAGSLRDASRGDPDQFGLGSLPPPPPPPPPDPILDEIVKVDDTHVTVTKQVIEHITTNPMAFAKGARVVPSMKNGVMDGLKLYAIRPYSAIARLGLSNGDTINSINGFPFTSMDKALEIYSKLRDATSLELEITRRGKPVTLNIKVI